MNAGYPDGNPNRITIRLKNGRTVQKLVKYPTGHTGKPMTNEEIVAKFNRLTEGYLSEQQREQGLKELWNLEEQTDYARLFKLFQCEHQITL